MQERLPDGPVQRTSLFGRAPGAGGGAYSAVSQADASGARQALEEDNDRLTLELERKVSVLKEATRSIHDEVSDHNRMLSVMVSRRSAPRAGERARRCRPQVPPAACTPRARPHASWQGDERWQAAAAAAWRRALIPSSLSSPPPPATVGQRL